VASRSIRAVICGLTGGRPVRCGYVHFRVTRRQCQRRTVPGVTIRCIRSRGGRTPNQRSEEDPVGPVRPGPRLGAPQDGDLMSQHEQLGVLGRRRAAEQYQPAADPGEHQVEHADGHGRPSCPAQAASVVAAQEACRLLTPRRHQARAAAMPEDGTGTQPVRRPYDLRHAALSLWLASGAPPAEVAARAGHSVRVLLITYAHCIPGCDQIASQQIAHALRPSRWPPAGPQEPAQTPGIPSVMRPCHSWT
jgi:hypothetical protein